MMMMMIMITAIMIDCSTGNGCQRIASGEVCSTRVVIVVVVAINFVIFSLSFINFCHRFRPVVIWDDVHPSVVSGSGDG